MPISVIQFNGSNAYEFQPGEFITSREFGILNMDDLALGVEVYTANTTSRLKATMRFIDEHGVLLSTSSSTYTPTVQNLWERALFTWSVPEGATRAELRLEGLTSVILMAQPKVANGTDPGSYGSNWSPQLTFLTPSGIYTGTLSAKQIILSAGEDLSDRLVTINANQILMSSKLDNRTTKITNEGVYTGEIVADQVKTGLLKSTNGASEINMANGSFNFGNGALTWSGSELTITGKFRSRFSAGKPTRVEIDNGKISIVNDNGTIVGEINNNNASVLEGLNINTGVGSKYLSFGHFVSAGGFIVDYYINHGENPLGRSERHIFLGDGYYSGSLTVSTIKHRSTNNNVFNTDATGTWISSPNGQTHLLLGDNVIQLVRNGTVLQQW